MENISIEYSKHKGYILIKATDGQYSEPWILQRAKNAFPGETIALIKKGDANDLYDIATNFPQEELSTSFDYFETLTWQNGTI
jgi:hypothetical protein